MCRGTGTAGTPATTAGWSGGSVLRESLDELRLAIEGLETELAEARQRLLDAESTLERLDEARGQAEGRLTLARRAVADFEARLEERHGAVQEALRAAAARAYEGARAERDAAAGRVGDAVRALVSAFETLEAARAELVSAEKEAKRVGAEIPRVPTPEPPLPADEWERLHALIGATSQARTEEELIAAAVQNSYVLSQLPAHLQEVARRRRQDLARRRAPRSAGGAPDPDRPPG